MRLLIGDKDGRTGSYVCQQGYHVRRSQEGMDALVTDLWVGRLAQPTAWCG